MHLSHARVLGFLLPLTLGIAPPVFGAEPISVRQEAVIHATADAVWGVAGNFADLGWHPAIASTQLLAGEAATPGARRRLTTRDGAQVTESLLSIDAQAKRYAYRMDATPMPVHNFEATLQVIDAGQESRVEWVAHFVPAPGSRVEDDRKMVEGFLSYGLTALQARFPLK